MRILVCGGRNYYDIEGFNDVMEACHRAVGDITIIHRGASGADTLAAIWAQNKGYEVIVFEADWKRYGSKAGTIRNTRMLDEGKPRAVIAFPGWYLGTKSMIMQVEARGIKVYKVPEVCYN